MEDGGARRREIKRRSYLKHHPKKIRDPEKIKAKRYSYTAAWKKRNPDKVKAIAARGRLKNAEKVRERTKRYYWATRAKRIKDAAVWSQANPDKMKAARLNYLKAHPERARINSQARRARIYSSEPDSDRIKRADIQFIREAQKNRCYWCSTRLKPGYHLDHIWPLAKGGSHKRNNLAIACPPCNRRKGAKTPAEFAGRLF